MTNCVFCGAETTNIIEDKAICTDDIMLLLRAIVITFKSNPNFFIQLKNSIDNFKKSV